MNKLFLILITGFVFVPAVYSQSEKVLAHSNDFIEIHELFKEKVYEIFERYNYFNVGLETKYFPVLDEKDKEITGEDKFFVLWLPGSDQIDLSFLFLCNNEEKEAIVFAFFEENYGDFIPSTRGNINVYLVNYVTSKLGDKNWFQ